MVENMRPGLSNAQLNVEYGNNIDHRDIAMTLKIKYTHIYTRTYWTPVR